MLVIVATSLLEHADYILPPHSTVCNQLPQASVSQPQPTEWGRATTSHAPTHRPLTLPAPLPPHSYTGVTKFTFTHQCKLISALLFCDT